MVHSGVGVAQQLVHRAAPLWVRNGPQAADAAELLAVDYEGSLERPADGREWPGQRWVLAGSEGYAVALANDAKYSYAAQDGTLYVTAARSPVYAHHDPYPLQEGESYPYIDQGLQGFTFRLLAGPDVDVRAAYRLADGLTRAPARRAGSRR